MASDVRNSRWCPTWGDLRGKLFHVNCLVVVTEENRDECAKAGQLEGRTLPVICPCECFVCRRAWTEDGLPILRDGKVVRHP
jgi:hypothetical protein